VYKSKTELVSPSIVEKIKKANWKKISRMLIMARDEQDMATDNLNLESQNIDSARGTKKFLDRIENDIGVQKIRFM
jgi:hypothetical protein